VLPSALEGYGIVLGEALHAGVPLIAARVGAAEDLIERTQAGLCFLPGDARALAGVLGEFVSHPALRAKLRAQASSAAATLPTWRETVSRFRSTLLSAC
jgi:glycosyltransferase involved in cell wall biosynthesis